METDTKYLSFSVLVQCRTGPLGAMTWQIKKARVFVKKAENLRLLRLISFFDELLEIYAFNFEVLLFELAMSIKMT